MSHFSTFPRGGGDEDRSWIASDDKSRSYYEELVRELYQINFFHPVKLGLQNVDRLHEAIGSPLDKIPVIHVAGTNGKGSVSLKIANSFQQSGKKVGLFCSPHVSSFRERMQVNGKLIEESEVETLLPRIFEACRVRDIPATFFEITTALAFCFYAQHNVDLVVLETGLGGRLDATNIVKEPLLSIITSIGLEHTRILGDTIELIAKEKAGIMKPGCPVLVGPHVPHDVLQQCAIEKGAGPYYTTPDILPQYNAIVEDYDEENSQTAQAAISLVLGKCPELGPLTEKQIDVGTSIRPPCRFEFVQVPAAHIDSTNSEEKMVEVILDVAHNPPAMEHLLKKVQSHFGSQTPNMRLVMGMSSDKDLAACGRMALELVRDEPGQLHLVQAAHPRSATLEAILNAVPKHEGINFDLQDRSITTQVNKALKLALERNETLIVCGSVFLMADVRQALGIIEPRDSACIEEVAGAHLRNGQEFFGNKPPSSMKNKDR